MNDRLPQSPFFSIIVPCCDVEPYVRECLESVLKQPFTDWECLIGVETSKDNTEAIVREYAAHDSRFKIFTGPRSGSCSVPGRAMWGTSVPVGTPRSVAISYSTYSPAGES